MNGQKRACIAIGACLFLFWGYQYLIVRAVLDVPDWRVLLLTLLYALMSVIGLVRFTADRTIATLSMGQTSTLLLAGLALLFFNTEYFYGAFGQNWQLYFPLQTLAQFQLFYSYDSAFHAALIESIRLNGYPSTCLDGCPAVFYHVLTHYLDALLLTLTGLDTVTSYGAMGRLKAASISVALLLLCWRLYRDEGGRRPLAWFFFTLFFVPLLVDDWHVVGSHAMYSGTLLLLLSFPWLWRCMTRNAPLGFRPACGIFLLVVLVALSKVSTGFMFAVCVGMVLWLRQPKNLLIYGLGMAWILFFLGFLWLMPTGLSVATDFDASLLWQETFRTDALLVVALLALAAWQGGKMAWTLAGSAAVAYLILLGVCYTLPLFNDRVFFAEGLRISLFFLLLGMWLNQPNRMTASTHAVGLKKHQHIIAGLLFLAAGAAVLLNTDNLYQGVWRGYLARMNSQPMALFVPGARSSRVGRWLTTRNLTDILFHDIPSQVPENNLQLIQKQIAALPKKARDYHFYMPRNAYMKGDPLVIRPGERQGQLTFDPMLLFALTGIPLIQHVVPLFDGTYAFSYYQPSSYITSRTAFDRDRLCRDYDIKAILYITRMNPFQFTTLQCLKVPPNDQ